MAIRPIVTTGIALTSAGLLVAAMPVIAPPLTEKEVRVVAQVDADLTAQSDDLLGGLLDFGAFDPAGLFDGFGLIGNLIGSGDLSAAEAFDFGALIRELNEVFWEGDVIGEDATGRVRVIDGFTGVAMVLTKHTMGALPLPVESEQLEGLVEAFYVGGPIIIGLLGFMMVNDALGTPIPEELVYDLFEGGFTKLIGDLIIDQWGDSAAGEFAETFIDEGFFGLVGLLSGGIFDRIFSPSDDDDEEAAATVLAAGTSEADENSSLSGDEGETESVDTDDEGAGEDSPEESPASGTEDDGLSSEAKGVAEQTSQTEQLDTTPEEPSSAAKDGVIADEDAEPAESTAGLQEVDVQTTPQPTLSRPSQKFTPSTTPGASLPKVGADLNTALDGLDQTGESTASTGTPTGGGTLGDGKATTADSGEASDGGDSDGGADSE